MSRTKFATRYYSLYIFNGEYCTRSASNYLNAVEDLEDVAKQGAEPLGVYDLHDWRFDWKLKDSTQQQQYQDGVLELTNSLRLKHEEAL
ncbi:hypothetical protein [Spirosoma sp. 209]|uniref:hypothetical protein n=1 Tax=Spirosoma sp. 209 TaxID=1955701 RepID=UPI001116CDE5|nr:hypothetical protein [Spirosoma sp. 209]